MALFALVAMLPLGTRLIISPGRLNGDAVEWGTVSIYATQVLAALVVCATAYRVWRGASPGNRAAAFRPDAPERAALLLAALAAASVAWAGNPVVAGVAAAWTLLGALLFMAIRRMRPNPRQVLLAFIVGAAFQAALALAQSFTQDISASTALGIAPHAPGDLGAFVVETGAFRWLRAYGTLPHPNVLGAMLALGILAAFAVVRRVASYAHPVARRVRAAMLALLPMLAGGLFFTFSRSAWVGFAAGVAAYAVFIVRSRNNAAEAGMDETAAHLRRAANRAVIVALGIVVATMGTFALLHADAFTARVRADGRLERQSVGERTSQLGQALALFRERPVLGFGAGQMPFALAERDMTSQNVMVFRHYPPGQQPDDAPLGSTRPGWVFQPVHVAPALVAVELGGVGLALWAAIALFALGVRLPGRTRAASVPPSSHQAVFRAMFVALLAMSLFDHYLWSLWIGQLLFWVTAALAAHPAPLDITPQLGKNVSTHPK